MVSTHQQHGLNEESAIVCVPTALIAEQLIMMIRELSSVNLDFDKLENLLLSARESELPINIEQFNLEKILDQYCNALLFWKIFVNQTIDVLSKYNQQYKYHLNVNPNLQFLDCFKAKYSAALGDVTDCFQFLLRLPRDCFQYVDFEAISDLIVALKDLHECLLSEEIKECYLKSVLNIEGAPKEISALHNHRFRLAQELNKKRVDCIAALELLKSSLKLEPFLTRADAAEFLIMKCKLIIHTTSTCSTLKNILSDSSKKFDLIIVGGATCMQGTDLYNNLTLLKAKNIALARDDRELQKREIDINTNGHVLFKALLSMDLKIHHFVQKEPLAVTDSNTMDLREKQLMGTNLKRFWTEISWIGIPKDLLPPVRQQGSIGNCAFQSSLSTTETHYKFEAYSDTPRRTFSVRLCVLDMDDQYEIVTGTRLGFENVKDKRTRLEKSFIVLKKRGVEGYSDISDKNVPIAFRIASFKKYSQDDLTNVCNLLRASKVMSGYFRLSRNFFTLSSGQHYKYDPQQPILNPKATQVCSHAVMLVGFLPTELPNERAPEYGGKENEKTIILAYQNSYGELFGENNGFSRIEASSVIKFFLPVL